MRQLALLTLVALVALPLSAHGGWRGPRRVVVEAPCRSERYWEHERHGHRGYGWGHRHDGCEDRVVLGPLPFPRPLPRPLPHPFQGRVELWIR